MTTILESTDRTLHPGREKQAYVWNPEGWDPRDQLPGRLHEYADYARYFIHRIFWGRIANRSHAEGLVPLKSEYLRQVLTDYDTYNEVRRSLLDSGCMVTDNSYSIGRKAKGYGLGPRLRGRKHVRTPVTSPAVARQIFKQRRREFRPPQTDVHRYLHDWLSRLEIDRPGAPGLYRELGPGRLACGVHTCDCRRGILLAGLSPGPLPHESHQPEDGTTAISPLRGDFARKSGRAKFATTAPLCPRAQLPQE